METANERLPEDIITIQILTRLPIKSLIRFSCVSKRWCSIVLSDQQFAKSYFKLSSERKTLSHRLLLSTTSQLISLDLQTPSFVDNSSVRNLNCPFRQPRRTFKILGSCNGIVCVALDLHTSFYLWNPTTGLFLKFPNPEFASETESGLDQCGFGYVSATNDYKVVVAGLIRNSAIPVEIFSSQANSWKRIDVPLEFSLKRSFVRRKGTLSNEALHWLQVLPVSNLDRNFKYTIIAFDLAKEEFRKIPVPLLSLGSVFFAIGVVFGGCLCLSTYDGRQYVRLRVMMEYNVGESWTKLFNFEVKDLFRPIFFTETRIVLHGFSPNKLIRYDHREEEKGDKVAVCSGKYWLEVGECEMIEYNETLFWLDDCQGIRETRTTLNQTQA